MPYGLKLQPEVEVLGQKWDCQVWWWEQGVAGTGRAAGSGLTCPLGTGNLLALVMNQESVKIVLNTPKINAEFYLSFW